MKSEVWDQVVIGGGFFTTENTADLENRQTHSHKIHTPQLPGVETLFISSNAYIKMKMYRIFFSTKK